MKRLDVYPRPEPYPAVPDWDVSGQGVLPRKRSGGIGWLPEGLLDRYSRTLVEGFIQKRVDELESSVTLVSADPSVPRKTFEPRGDVKIKDHLHISYLSPRFFTTLLLAPSAKHALLLGGITERLFVASSPESFLRLFETSDSDLGMDCDLVASLSLQQRLRVWMIPEPLVGASLYPIPFRHPLDAKRTLSFESFKTLTFLFTSVTLDFVERALYIALHARFVPGGEPWKRWHRALQHM